MNLTVKISGNRGSQQEIFFSTKVKKKIVPQCFPTFLGYGLFLDQYKFSRNQDGRRVRE